MPSVVHVKVKLGQLTALDLKRELNICITSVHFMSVIQVDTGPKTQFCTLCLFIS